MGQVDKQADQIRLRTHERPLPGELILLENQDRSLWNREQIAEGLELVENALGSLLEQGELANYYLAHSARAELCRRLSRTAEPGRLMKKLWRSLNRNQSGNSCKSGFSS